MGWAVRRCAQLPVRRGIGSTPSAATSAEGLTLIDIILVQLAIIFLPGLIWAQIDARYAAKEKPGQAEFVIRAFLFGMSTYAIAYVGYRVFGRNFSDFGIDGPGSTRLLRGEFVDEIIVSAVLSFVLAIVWIYVANYKLLNKLLLLMKATSKYGHEDVWDFTFASSGEEVEYVHVRDFNRGIIYAGWVHIFSETGKMRELLLKDVIMYDSEGHQTGTVPLLYFAKDGSDVHIEFPHRGPGHGQEVKQSDG